MFTDNALVGQHIQMDSKIRVGIVGYGNLGRGVELAISQSPDLELVGVFSRRDPASVETVGSDVPVYEMAELERFTKTSTGRANSATTQTIDVAILCGSSSGDLPNQTPKLARWFNTVDSFDTHANIPAYFESVDGPAREGRHVSIISTGWDPGLFSLQRLLGEAILPEGDTYTFWGKGLSQGHSAALRGVDGVADAVQYTVPALEAMELARSGSRPELSTKEKHTRDCYVVLEQGADAEAVREAIVTMPAYFADYDTTVTFISLEELEQEHSAMPHGGFVIRSGQTADEATQTVEFSLKLASNPSFTAAVLVAYARAAYRLFKSGAAGAFTPFDVAPGLLSPKSAAELRQGLL